MDAVSIEGWDFRGEWHYTIHPGERPDGGPMALHQPESAML